MPRLAIRLFGPLQVTLDDSPVTAFESDKGRALLAYLAAEAQYPQRRETLVGLLWPDVPEQTARRNLSQALFQLRQIIGDASTVPPFLLITRDTLQFNMFSSYFLDVAEFAKLRAAWQLH